MQLNENIFIKEKKNKCVPDQHAFKWKFACNIDYKFEFPNFSVWKTGGATWKPLNITVYTVNTVDSSGWFEPKLCNHAGLWEAK